jgi:hypothetical protein
MQEERYDQFSRAPHEVHCSIPQTSDSVGMQRGKECNAARTDKCIMTSHIHYATTY